MEISKEQIKNLNNEFKQLKMAGGNIKKKIAEVEVEEGGVWKEGRIPRKILKQIGEEAYKENPSVSLTDSDGNNWRLVDKFPTMVSYQSPAYRFKYVVGIRGTSLKSFTDIKADVAHLFGKVGESERYEKDKEYLRNMITRHGKHNRFILVGHSLAGAIIKRLAKDLMTKNYIEYTLSYNPSFELSDTKKNEADERIHEVYSENDPLLKIREVVQPNVRNNPNVEVLDEKNKGLLESHSIENPTFEGGILDEEIFDGGLFVIPDEVKQLPQFKDVKSGVYKNLNMIKYMRTVPKYKEYLQNAKPNKTMLRWIKENWINVREALMGYKVPCGRPTLDTEPYPLCRPLKRISKETPITFPELMQSGAEKKILKAVKAKEKRPGIRIMWRKMLTDENFIIPEKKKAKAPKAPVNVAEAPAEAPKAPVKKVFKKGNQKFILYKKPEEEAAEAPKAPVKKVFKKGNKTFILNKKPEEEAAEAPAEAPKAPVKKVFKKGKQTFILNKNPEEEAAEAPKAPVKKVFKKGNQKFILNKKIEEEAAEAPKKKVLLKMSKEQFEKIPRLKKKKLVKMPKKKAEVEEVVEEVQEEPKAAVKKVFKKGKQTFILNKK